MKTLKVKSPTQIPTCNFCHIAPGIYDAPTVHGPWADMCEYCVKMYGGNISIGSKKVLVEEPEGEPKLHDEVAWANSLDFEELEAIVMDGDAYCVDGCCVEPDGKCEHGYRSPLLILGLICLMVALIFPSTASAQLYGGWGGTYNGNAQFYNSGASPFMRQRYMYERYRLGYYQNLGGGRWTVVYPYYYGR